MSIEEMVNDMVRHKADFIPSKDKYINYVFQYADDFVQVYGKGTHYIPKLMEYLISEDLLAVTTNYYSNNQLYPVYVPDTKYIAEVLEMDLKESVHHGAVVALEKYFKKEGRD